ncbi:hypothetical protein [Streptomyces sp. NPDC058247]|uniref:hypothetical protein n=1 Tax=Streptomyces sp. NPDC058247 TaxID=3346401 RepID=UPI0036EDC694
MTNLPEGWTLTDSEDEYGPHILKRGGTPVAALRLRIEQQFRDSVTGQWEWHGLSGAAEMEMWTESGFHDFDDAVEAAIGRLAETRLWTIADVAQYLDASSTGSARKTLSRWDVKAVARQPGRAGASLYDPNQVRAAREAAPGQGARTDRATEK